MTTTSTAMSAEGAAGPPAAGAVAVAMEISVRAEFLVMKRWRECAGDRYDSTGSPVSPGFDA
jgi:hypothetical protein